jgi:hypothetical protein
VFVAKDVELFEILKVLSESFNPILKTSPLAVVKFKAESLPFNLVSSVATSEKIPLVAVTVPAKVVLLPLTVIGALPKVSESVTEPAEPQFDLYLHLTIQMSYLSFATD